VRKDFPPELSIIDGTMCTFPFGGLSLMLCMPLPSLAIGSLSVGRILACRAQLGEELRASGFEALKGFYVPLG
jgi:hypothetical protein